MLKDIRYALRAVRQNPGFALTAIISIALAIGANSAIFSYADLMLFRPLSVPNPSEVVTLHSLAPSVSSVSASGTGLMSYPEFLDFQNQARSFEGIVAYTMPFVGFAPDVKAHAQTEMGMAVSGDFFDVLHVPAAVGRTFLPEEGQVPDRDAVVVLSHDFWTHQYGADRGVIGRKVLLNGAEFVIVGVAPESFTGMDQWVFPAFYFPAMMVGKIQSIGPDALTNRSRRMFDVKGRLKAGVSIQAAAVETAGIAKRLEQSYPATNRGYGATVHTEFQTRNERETGAGFMAALLIATVGTVLLIACANVANLMLVRGRARSREIAVRLALGASRTQVIRELMAESLIIAVAGGALALLVAGFAIESFSSMQIPSDAPVRLIFKLDARVVWFTFLISIGSALVFGLAPALASTKTDLISAMKAGEAEQSRRRIFGRSALVTVQIAGSLAVLMGAAQTYSNATTLLRDNLGFRTDHRLTMRLDPQLAGYSNEKTRQFYDTLIERLLQTPGVKSAALASSLPMTWDISGRTVIPEGYEFPKGKEGVDVMVNVVDHHYFETIGMPILEGRGFLDSDRHGSRPVVVVNQAFAREYLGLEPIGKRVRIGTDGAWAEVVGVTPVSKYVSPLEPSFKYMYLPLPQVTRSRMTVIIETLGNPADMAAPIQEVIRSIDNALPVFRVQTMDFVFENYFIKGADGLSQMFAAAGLLALVLALVGLYAVVSHEVGRRTREIGIRIAIGAGEQHVMRMILRQALKMSLSGVLIGVVITFAGGQFLKAAVEARFSYALLVLISLSLFATTLLAAAIPARRASRVDAMSALRQE